MICPLLWLINLLTYSDTERALLDSRRQFDVDSLVEIWVVPRINRNKRSQCSDSASKRTLSPYCYQHRLSSGLWFRFSRNPTLNNYCSATNAKTWLDTVFHLLITTQLSDKV